jgi:DNA-binding transcriptional LysR family regulator
VITIASTGSFSRAADELQIAQPTLSKYIQKLEKNIGIELFDRSTIPIRLTTAGELYVTAGKKMIDDDRQLQKQLQEVKYNQNLEIKVGISPSRAPYLMPFILSKYQAQSTHIHRMFRSYPGRLFRTGAHQIAWCQVSNLFCSTPDLLK